MAVPKKKTSPSRRGLRRAGQHHRLYRQYPINCPNCGAPALPHKVCSSCGFYRGMQVISMPVEEEGGEESDSKES